MITRTLVTPRVRARNCDRKDAFSSAKALELRKSCGEDSPPPGGGLITKHPDLVGGLNQHPSEKYFFVKLERISPGIGVKARNV